MAEQRAQDVVDQTLSADAISSSDAPAITSNTDSKFLGEAESVLEIAINENGLHAASLAKMEDLEDASGRSDTDTSRAEGSVAGDKTAEPKLVKKFAAKPVSFAKYSVPKVIAANAAVKSTDKATTPSSSTSSLQQIGRPRLVAKTTSSLQQQVKPYKTASPDPMQVWNKNRVTPQPSTKHLTDEELKQQYGIHLTSRLQADGEGKEAKWADIDDDEDDWAPETIEWNDGTKTTLTAADVVPSAVQKANADTSVPDQESQAQPSKILTPQFSSTIGPNATVLKLGASAERQQAQKAAERLSKSPLDGSGLSGSKTNPAPAPAKSPWAPLPPVDRASPITITPQPMPPSRFPGPGYSQSPSALTAPSPAKEISADDFNRSWRDSISGQPRELYMPNSGRYEAVPEGGRRRMSKNDHNFRAPAVLQRPSQSESHAPAEPSAAFQTNRTSADSARRRASSTISGGSGQFARRMSVKSGDGPPPVFDSQPRDPSLRPSSRDGPVSQTQTPSYQARIPSVDYMTAGNPAPAQNDFDAQVMQQKAVMKETIERARQRKIEDEAREEAQRKERIKAKLASLGPAPVIERHAVEEAAPTGEKRASQDSGVSAGPNSVPNHSPPKPPQPLATGEPQQYGMMKVHALDTVKKTVSQQSEHAKLSRSDPKDTETVSSKSAPAMLNGIRSSHGTQRHAVSDALAPPDRSPRTAKPASTGSDARSGWGDIRDHRSAGNLWGLPNNKALGNGTFDQTLAGYAPQDLSRTPTSAQGWMSGRTPTAGRSPQPQYANHLVGESRPQPPQPVTSPDQPPLAADSEADSLFPTTRPEPIGPPQTQAVQPPVNGFPAGPHTNGNLAAWNNFHQVAGPQERVENERYQRDLAAKREEELRTGAQQGPQYTFNETWKQVNLGDQAGQRQISNVNQASIPASQAFGTLGSLPVADISNRTTNGQAGRGSRFFPQNINGYPPQDRRSFTYSHPTVSRTPSPPPAEEYASFHPAFDGDLNRPAVRFPREKAVVKLPPAMDPLPAPKSPTPVEADVAPQPEAPLTWAARVSMPVPSPPTLRSVSTPLVQNPSWQERFNGLLGKKTSPVRQTVQLATPVLAITSATRESLDFILPVISASVSLPQHAAVDFLGESELDVSEQVDAEEELFEDREYASLPVIKLPQDAILVQLPLAETPRKLSAMVDPTTISHYMVNNAYERHFQKPQFAIIRMPESTKSVKKDIPLKGGAPQNGDPRSRNASGGHLGKHGRFNRGPKPRQTSKAH